MGKTKKLYLAKRMLAMILAAAMSVTMIPSTALAATADDIATEDVVNDAAAENSDTDVPADDDVTADGTDNAVLDGTDGTVEDTDGDITDGKVQNTAQETTEGAADGEESTDTVEPKADTPAQPSYEISFAGSFDTEVVYDGETRFADILDYVTLSKDGEEVTDSAEKDKITCVWKQGDAVIAAAPKAAGSYQAVLTYPKQDGVHEGAEKTVDFEIKKVPLTINLNRVEVKPGALKDSVKVEIDSVEVAAADQAVLTKENIVLTVDEVRNAIADTPLGQDEKMEKDGDYVADITPSLKADASEAAKAAAKNYEIEPFTADIEMGDSTETRIVVTLVPQEAKNIKRVYDDKPVEAPALTTEYTYEVQYEDAASQTGWTAFEADKAKVVGNWEEYNDCEVDDKGEVKAPTDAGTYTYIFTYEDKDGVYADSTSDEIKVVVDPAPVTVAITNAKDKPIKTEAGSLMTKVLAQVTYEAKTKDRTDKDVKINPKENHIWGTGYNDANVSQVYEPAFTLQVKEGTAWKSITDADYRMEGGKEYRVIYEGKKAIYNADGTYAHRTGINSGLDEDGEEINGVSGNYTTDETPSTDEQALTVTVEAGVEMDWDLSGLDKKAGETPEAAEAKEYDGTPLYANKSDYKNKIKLKGVTENKTLDAVGNDFTYTWYKSGVEDLLDKEILDQNKANGFSTSGFEDQGWDELGNITAPTDAGIYKLEISYADHTDDGTLYHVKDGRTAVVYFVINKVQLTITPEGEYSTLSGGTAVDFFNNNKITYQMDKKLDGIEPYWTIYEYKKQDDGTTSPNGSYDEDDDYSVLTFDDTGKTEYKIQASNVKYWDKNDYEYYIDYNYTTCEKIKTEEDAVNAAGETKKRADYKEEPLGGTVPFTVNKMGEKVLNLTPIPEKPVNYEKPYDGETITIGKDVKPEEAYTLTTTENGQSVEVSKDLVQYLCRNKADADDECMLEDLRNAGEYDLYACFWGNEEYAPLDLGPEPVTVPGKLIGTVKIEKRPISLELKVNDTYEAGRTTELLSDIENAYRVTGYAESDEWAFSRDNGEYAWDEGPNFRVYEKGSKTPLSGNILHRNKEFVIRYNAENSSLESYEFDRNYEVTTTAEEDLCAFKTIAAPAGITSASLSGVESLAIGTPEVTRDNKGISQTVNVLEGISYSQYNGRDVDGETVNMTGNLAAFTIYAPAEFGGQIPDTAMYKNEVEKAGGKVVSEQASRGRFTVLFDASEGAKTFPIRWEDKYVETIALNFNKDQCLGNLQDAVAPKSLAFNAAPKKLAIGSSVQLDVKITKAQMADVICLGYKSSNESVMHVNPESGYVTALKKEKATITVFPQHMNEDGDMVPIEGAKTATVTIEGTLVTAPKPVTVSAHGKYADVNYGVVSDGYRREIYVAAGKQNAKALDDKVKALQGNKNQWRNDFVIAPIYQDSADESYNRYRNNYTARLTGLEINKQYTVYVRNVCEAKTLSDGNKITQSTVDASAAGTAVTFTTLKSEMTALDLKLDETVDGITDVTNYSSGTVPAFYSGIRTYRVDFSKIKALDSKTLGRFFLNASDAAADSSDYLDLALPMDKKYKGVYQEPKLQYYVWTTDKNGDRVKASKNEFVSVDKKGKIKLTGITGYYDGDNDEYGDGVYIYVYDSSLNRSANIRLIIDADVDSVAAKKKTVNLSVGQSVDLNDIALYTYKVGKTKLTSYEGPDMDMDAVRTAVKAQEEYFALDGTWLTAIKGGGKLELSLTDKNVKRVAKLETNATAKITFASKDLAPVKKIKAIDVTNDKFGLTFTHAGEAEAFRVEIIDSSKKKLLDKRYERNNGAWEVWAVSGNRDRRVKDTYRIDAHQIQRDVLAGGGRLAKESQYTVKITALYDGISAKPGTGKVKTTKIPAVDGPLEDYYKRSGYDEDGNYLGSDREGQLVLDQNGKPILVKPRGGMSISVSEGNKTLYVDEDNDEYNDYLRVLSGNSYTLTANPSNRGRVNDTLVWTIGDKKVASVKAAAGTYCITLKGLKPGSTVLEVKSKILGNKVIARYDIYVVAVGDAYKDGSTIRYRGDDEQEDYHEPGYPEGIGSNAPTYMPLSVGDPRKVRGAQDNYFRFTAPETARYAFETTGSASVYKKNDNGNWNYCGSDLGWLEGGKTIYLRSNVSGNAVNNAYYVEITVTERFESAENGVTVTGEGSRKTFTFKAPETGAYQFSLSGSGSKERLNLYTDVNNVINGGSASDSGTVIVCTLQKDVSVYLRTVSSLKTGQTYTLEVKRIDEEVAFGTPKPVTLTSGATTYLMYAIEKSGRYQFSAAADSVSYSVSGEIKVGDEVRTTISGTNFSEKLELNQGDVVCVKVTNNDSTDVTFTVNTKDITPADLSTASGTVPNGRDTFYGFTASTAGAYQFTMTVDQANASDTELNIWNSVSDADNYETPLATGTAGAAGADGKVTITASVVLSAGQTVYVNPVNNSGSDLAVTVGGTKDTSVSEITAAGTEITLTANAEANAIFVASEAGIYEFTTTDGATYDREFELITGNSTTGSITVYSGNELSKKIALSSGQTVLCKMVAYTDAQFSLRAELTDAFGELKLGKATQASILGIGAAPDGQATAAGFVFTVPETGIYTFWSESITETVDTYGLLYNLDDVDVNYCLSFSHGNNYNELISDDDSRGNRNFAIEWELEKGSVVYLKCRGYDESTTGEFNVFVGKGSQPWNN